MRIKINRKIARLIGVVIFIIILIKINVRSVLVFFAKANPILILISVFCLITVHICKAWRWQILLRAQGISYSLKDCYFMYLAGLYVGVVTPGRLGDAIKMLYLTEDGYSVNQGIVSVIVDRVMDLVLLLLCAYLSFLWVIIYTQGYHSLFLFYVLLPIVVCSVAYCVRNRVILLLKELCNHSIFKWFHVKIDFSELREQFRMITSKFVTLTILTLVGWLVYFFVIYFITYSINLGMPFLRMVAFFFISTVIAFIPISIAGVGVRDITLIALFKTTEQGREIAIAFSLCILLVYFLTGLFGYIGFLKKPISYHVMSKW